MDGADMKNWTPLTLMRIAVVIFAITQFGNAEAAKLRYVRTGKHDNFMRIVFEFQNKIEFKNPEITDKGQFSVDFLDTSTSLPRRTFYKTGPLQLVQSIELIPQELNLTATVRLSYPYFTLKSFPLSGPDRVVVDAYWMPSPSDKSGQQEPLGEKPLPEITLPSETKEPENSPRTIPVKEVSKQPITALNAQKLSQDQPQTPQHTVSNKTPDQAPMEKNGLSPYFKNNYTAQTYLLVLLNVFTGCIAMMFIFTLLRKKHVKEFGDSVNFLEFIKNSDDDIAAVDAEIDKAFKKYDQF